jgi:hypothetical protein
MYKYFTPKPLFLKDLGKTSAKPLNPKDRHWGDYLRRASIEESPINKNADVNLEPAETALPFPNAFFEEY